MFRIIVLNAHDFILEFKDFNINQQEEMSDYLIYACIMRKDVRIIKIIKWEDDH